VLVSFRMNNYRSFAHTAELSMRQVASYSEYPENVIPEHRLLKSAALYGANASGKSNVIKALLEMRKIVLSSAKNNSADSLPYDPFIFDATLGAAPVRFEVQFINYGEYRYGFSVTCEKIVTEWLFAVNGGEEHALFLREDDNIDIREFSVPPNAVEETKANTLFISKLDQMNHGVAKNVIGWFNNLVAISGVEDRGYELYTGAQLVNPEKRERIMDFVRLADATILGSKLVGLSEKELGKFHVPANSGDNLYFQPRFLHRCRGEETNKGKILPPEEESSGTQKSFRIAGPLFDILDHGRVVLFDEIEAKMHLLLTLNVLGMFNSVAENPHNAQMIFATHDTNLLSYAHLRRDQVWFTEKSLQGESVLYPLSDCKDIEPDGNKLEVQYLSGKFGGIPVFGAFADNDLAQGGSCHG